MVLAFLFSALVAAASPPGAAPAMPGSPPAWAEVLPDQPGRLYALGTADLGTQNGQAVLRASERARWAVVARLRTTVKGRTSVTTATVENRLGGQGATSGDRRVLDEVTVAAQAQDLPGLVVERTHVDPAARTAYALAYLDLAQARAAMASRLAEIHEECIRVGGEASRMARWRLRRLKPELDQVDETLRLLAPTGTGLDLRPALQAERGAVDTRLATLDARDLPPLDFAKTTVGFRTNVDLPLGIETYLVAQIKACGLQHRELNPDLMLDLTFSGGPKGPEFIFAEMEVYGGVTYRLAAQLKLLEGGGLAVAKPAPIQIVQQDSPEGMVNQFRRQFERRLPKLFAEFRSALQ